MNIEKLSEFLAVEVMGFVVETQPIRLRFVDPNTGRDYGWCENWSPPTNIEQAMMCAKNISKTHIVKIVLNDDYASCDINFERYFAICNYEDYNCADAMAISLACARAVGYQE